MEHYWHTLPGPVWFSATAIYRLQVDRAEPGAAFVEVGAWKGRSAAFMAVEIINSGKDIEFYVVDHWLGSNEPAHQRDSDAASGRLYEVFLRNIEPVKSHVIPVRGHSTETASHFADRSLDFIYLDAGHTYSDVLADLAAWWPKVKDDGVIAGDDWCFEDRAKERGVARAVTEFFAALRRKIVLEPGNPNPDWLQWIVAKREDR